MVRNNHVHNNPTRRSNEYRLPLLRTVLDQNSFVFTNWYSRFVVEWVRETPESPPPPSHWVKYISWKDDFLPPTI